MNEAGKGLAGAPGGLVGWLLARLRRRPGTERRLVLVERITLGQRQTLSLVQADGRSILVANSSDGASFYPLEGRDSSRGGDMYPARKQGRVSW